jgi:hypothetical protein
MANINQQLTSVKVDKKLFDEFKVLCVRTKFSLQKLTDRGLHLYITDERFRGMLHSHLSTEFTGSFK